MELADFERWSPQRGFYDVSDILVRHIYERSHEMFSAGDETRAALATPDEIAARQVYIREKFLAGIGGLPPSDTPLNARTVGTIEGEGFRIEKVIFESRPRHYVTANLYLPDDLPETGAAVLSSAGIIGRRNITRSTSRSASILFVPV